MLTKPLRDALDEPYRASMQDLGDVLAPHIDPPPVRLAYTADPSVVLAYSRSHPDRAPYRITAADTLFPKCPCLARGECSHIVALMEAQMTATAPETVTAAVVPFRGGTVTRRAEEARAALAATRVGIEDAMFLADMQRAMWPEDIRNKPPEEGRRTAGLIIMTAVELGVSAMQAFSYIAVIKGKPFLMARMVNALVSSRIPGAYIQITDRKGTSVTGEAHRPGRPTTTVTITIEDANRAGWSSNALYKTNPAAMLTARVTTTLGWIQFADVLAGMDAFDEDAGLMSAVSVDQMPPHAIRSDVIEGEAKTVIVEPERVMHEPATDPDDVPFEDAPPALPAILATTPDRDAARETKSAWFDAFNDWCFATGVGPEPVSEAMGGLDPTYGNIAGYLRAQDITAEKLLQRAADIQARG